jgi:hypothetical protein
VSKRISHVDLAVGPLVASFRERGIPEEVLASGERRGILDAAHASGTLDLLVEVLTKKVEEALAEYVARTEQLAKMHADLDQAIRASGGMAKVMGQDLEDRPWSSFGVGYVPPERRERDGP